MKICSSIDHHGHCAVQAASFPLITRARLTMSYMNQSSLTAKPHSASSFWITTYDAKVACASVAASKILYQKRFVDIYYSYRTYSEFVHQRGESSPRPKFGEPFRCAISGRAERLEEGQARSRRVDWGGCPWGRPVEQHIPARRRRKG